MKVKDYKLWKKSFDDGIEDHRRAAGSKGGYIYRDADEPNTIIILLEWDNLENANKFLTFMQSEKMQKVFQESGVLGPPLAVHVFGETEKASV